MLDLLKYIHTYIHTYTRLTALFPGLPRWADTRKVKPIGILLKQKTVSRSGISWAICKSAPRSRQITTPAPHHSVFPSCRPTNSVKALKAWCWTFLQSDFNLRRPHIARQQQLSVYIVPRPTSAANPPAAAAAVDRRDRQTDGRTDGHATVLGRLRILCRPRYNQLISVFSLKVELGWLSNKRRRNKVRKRVPMLVMQ